MIINLSQKICAKELLAPLCNDLTDNRLIKCIVTNSNEASTDSVFVGIKGASDDGNKYSRDAKIRGAFVISNDLENSDLYSPDGIDAIRLIAKNYKEKMLKLKHTIAITGSVGKTTTKNILKEMLSASKAIHATNENFNNLLGVSITILTAPLETEILVVEAGMNHKGELAIISDLLSPDIIIITNIGSAHIGNLGSREAIASAKLEIINKSSTKVCIVPHDEPLLRHIENKMTFSINDKEANSFINPIKINRSGSVFDLTCNEINVRGVKTSLVGEHILKLISAASCALCFLGFHSEELKTALSKSELANTRAKLICIGRIRVLDDSYNASFESMLASFNTVLLYDKNASCVIGDVLELGKMSESIHEELGKEIARRKFKKLYTFGKLATHTALAAINCGIDPDSVFINENLDSPEITARQISKSYSDEIILVKASRATGAERIYKELILIEERRKENADE